MSSTRTLRYVSVLILALAVAAGGSPLAAQQPEHPTGTPPKNLPEAPALGVQGMDANAKPELPPGITVVSTTEGGPGEAAGLLPGDVMVKVDGADVADLPMLLRIVRGHKIGDVIEITFQRAGETRSTKATLTSSRELSEKTRKRDQLIGLPLPALRIAEWIGTPIEPAALQGKVVVLNFFEMLCPGSLEYGLPRTQKWWEKYGQNPDAKVIGIHSVWEMHDRQGPEAIKEFVTRRGISWPVAIDQVGEGTQVPQTLWACRILTPDRRQRLSTPGVVVADKKGVVRFKAHGEIDMAKVEALIDQLLAEPAK